MSETTEAQPLSWEWPGAVNFDVYHGCLAMMFAGVDELNAYARENAKLLCVKLEVLNGGLMGLFTKRFDSNELEELEAFSRLAESHMREWRQTRAEQQRKDREAETAALADQKRLAEQGSKCKKDHGGMDKVKVQIKKLRKQIVELGGKPDAED